MKTKKINLKKLRKDLTREKFGRLTALYPIRKNKFIYWVCRCDCGVLREVYQPNLMRQESCGCIRGYQDKSLSSFNELFGSYRRNARNKEVGFAISKTRFREITLRPCYYCGQPPSKEILGTGAKRPFIYNGLDRVNPLKGYSPKNCVPCCQNCNRMKGRLSQEKFLSQTEAIFAHLKL